MNRHSIFGVRFDCKLKIYDNFTFPSIQFKYTVQTLYVVTTLARQRNV